MDLKLYNTLTRKKEIFRPLKDRQVGIYTCGPTVYWYQHIGNLRSYIFPDILKRIFLLNGFKVKHVMNITDVGHLTSDADEGEDKLEKGTRDMLYFKCKNCGKDSPSFIASAGEAFRTLTIVNCAADCQFCGTENEFYKEKEKTNLFHKSEKEEEKATAWDIAEHFTKIYLENRRKLNLLKPTRICKATDNIKEMIKLVQILLNKSFAYEISDGIYFDTAKFKNYGQLSGNTLEKLKEGARVEINPDKKNPTDFALWKFSPKGEKRQMEWKSFGKMGFPGWHIECSAMSMKYLGDTFDIHTGGEDNIFPHHESEIAQSEAATGQKFVNFWFHTRFLQVEGKKMSKSLKNFYTIQDLEKKGFSALDLRYLFLTAHYRSKLNFTWQSLAAAQVALKNLQQKFSELDKPKNNCPQFEEKFLVAINDDINLPQALAVVWDLLNSNCPSGAKKKTLLKFDEVLGLGLNKIKQVKIPKEILKLVKERESAREQKDWQKADELRKEIEKLGYAVEDTANGSQVIKK